MNPNKIIIHHSLTADSSTVSWGAIRKWHTGLTGSPIKGDPNYNPYIENPMDDIGYGFGIELINDHYEILMGRRPDLVGAHTIGKNDQSIGICVVGNYDIDPVTQEIKETIQKLLTWLILTYKIEPREIYGHCQFSQKTCPGKNMMDWIKTIR
jgi:hypothetical protein